MSVRERDDVVTIWNTRSDLAEQSNLIEKIQELLPSVNFTATFYKGRFFRMFKKKVIMSKMDPYELSAEYGIRKRGGIVLEHQTSNPSPGFDPHRRHHVVSL